MSEALEKSIQKWIDIRDNNGVDRGTQNCALCEAYLTKPQESNCEDCPVCEATQEIHCYGTPYEEWVDHQSAMHDVICNHQIKDDCPTCLELVNKEIKFLESLRD